MKTRATILILFAVVSMLLSVSLPGGGVYITKSGNVEFISEAPLETIKASNDKVGVVLNAAQKTVAFKVPIAAFVGFNSELQHEHFNENYMEIDAYPQATFTGKIIEDVDLSVAGTYRVRAKGMLSVHGVDKERIVPGTIVVSASGVKMDARFEVPVADHNISIPKIVNQKIAEVIQVEVKADLKPQS